MLVRSSGEVEYSEVRAEGAAPCRMRELITAADGAPTFAMRQFEVTPGGHTPFHCHPWEHEVFILAGAGKVELSTGSRSVAAGDAVFVAPNEMHCFGCVGDEPLRFLCMIPVAETCCR